MLSFFCLLKKLVSTCLRSHVRFRLLNHSEYTCVYACTCLYVRVYVKILFRLHVTICIATYLPVGMHF